MTRALRLIEEGALDDGNVEELASRIGIGSRHLNRLFLRHLGATPKRVAQTRRLHLALKLLDESNLSIAEIAFASGFGSVRRFNEVILDTYGRPPSHLRRRQTGGESSCISLDLSYRPPLSWHRFKEFLRVRAVCGLEEIASHYYRRSVSIGSESGWIQVEPVPGIDKLRLSVSFPNLAALPRIVARVRRMFDLDADPTTIDADLRADASLAQRLDRDPGLRVPAAWDGFEIAVRAILGQGISLRAATTLTGRLVARYGSALERSDSQASLSRVFPQATLLATCDLDGLGVPEQRAAALRALATAVAEDRIDLSGVQSLREFTTSLETIPGIGSWTSRYIALRLGCYTDAFPAGDLGLLRGAVACGLKLKREPTQRELAGYAERWRPWRAYAAAHLWLAYSEAPKPARL